MADLQLATLTPDGGKPPITVMYNPSEYTLKRSVSYAEVAIPGLDQPVLQYVRGDSDVLSMELFLDSSDTPYDKASTATTPVVTVKDKVTALEALTRIDGTTHAPPIVTFHWGDQSFRGVITSLQERFQLFDEAGRVLRARFSVEMKRFEVPDTLLQAANKKSPDRTHTWVVREGDRLTQIAQAHYGDASQWRFIAESNDIDRPRRLTPGAVLLLPAL
ncbi:MAG TPA: LysM peptidoglycan-binding domain-containing protein [Myxococcota bacterium]|nr:LysM peptidoglycan-binding domain-containing protein [Myxococcota bacterium]